MFLHPILLAFERSKAINEFASDHINKERLSLVKVGDGETNVFGSAQAWYSGHLRVPPSDWIQSRPFRVN
jgi:hypothetical protein